MSTLTDSLGTWEQLGEVNLSLQWDLTEDQIIGGTFFRFTYNIDWSAWSLQLDGKSYAIARFYYLNGNNITVSPSFRLFPKQQQEVRELLIPQELSSKGIIERWLGFKLVRIGLYSKLIAAPIIPWSITTEYLIS